MQSVEDTSFSYNNGRISVGQDRFSNNGPKEVNSRTNTNGKPFYQIKVLDRITSSIRFSRFKKPDLIETVC
jgi:hypothetical protein